MIRSASSAAAQILVIDDHDGVREMVAAIVEELGHRPRTAATGKEGVEIAQGGDIDLVVTDLMLPDIDGQEVLRRCREINPLLPVILLTGYPTVDQAIQAIKQGACEFLTKPVKLEVLERSITRALEEKRLIEENQRLMAEANKVAVIERLNARLNAKLNESVNLNRISDALSTADDNSTVFRRVVDLTTELTGAQRVSLMLVTPDADTLKICEARGLSEHVLSETEVQLGDGVAGAVAQRRAPLFITRDSTSPMYARPGHYDAPSFISIPLEISGEVLGVLNLADKLGGEDFSEEDFALVQALADKAAIRVENNALYESIYCNLVDTLSSLVTTLEAKDPYTKEHSKRVTQMALALAREMGATEDELESISFAGMLHDIGKIGVRDSVLLKPNELTHAEFEIIKTHPVIGEQIVEPLGLVKAERDIIRHHHERMDGNGYPDGLVGEEIPKLARIVAVADAFDAMTTTRPYRQALTTSAALQEFERSRGQQHDPEVIDALHRVLEGERDQDLIAAATTAR